MGRRYDNAPVRNTCPLINDVISYIERARSSTDSLDLQDKDYDSLDDIHHDLDKALPIMEEIRSANSSLREWGNEL